MKYAGKSVLTEEKMRHYGSLFGDCIKDVYGDSLPDATFKIYVTSTEFITLENGELSSKWTNN